MKFGDIIALARAGYKYSEVKELMSLAEDTKTDGTEEPAEIPEEDPAQPEQEKVIEQPEALEAAGSDDKIKAMQTQIDDLKKQLAKAQKQNIKSDLSGSQPKTDSLEEIARRFM